MSTSRRQVIGGFGAALIAGQGFASSAAPGKASASAKQAWPAGFVWGVATAAHQIEGNNVNSDYWVLEHARGSKFKDQSGDACDSWNRWREDVDLVHGMGLTAYRFSVEWARIEPERGHFSEAALGHYRRMCLRCREVGIMPIVTFHHFTSPRWVAVMGGFENPAVASLFARYCERTARALGDLIGAACTMNEPNAQVTSYVMRGYQPYPGEANVAAEAARSLGAERFAAYFLGDALKARDGCLKAHVLATQAIKSVVPGLKVGLTLALQDLLPGPGGAELHRRVFDEARGPFYEAAGADDFVGVQPYMRLRTGPDGYLPAPAGVPLNRYGADASPDVLGAVVREAHRHCKAPILVSEHGIDTIDDRQRSVHLEASVAVLAQCVAEGLPVLGYLHWSLLDNFEWSSGYEPRFGLVAVDRKSFVRTPKPSAKAFRDIVAGAGAKRGRNRM
ncbi:glycoside hydrolase family 1 protein [Massilia glaciei]|uniref:Glycoside hydrolase family 1 protein n=1 Tax=Massilia glaciei TaxID=1524097 RepID=A0A2U2HDX3_9BURK|nr:family 1 glycosylhydrolase [Massilia glaciei]PWF41452.1 glycoside hydrolase family 1 protein [Massilia glaciei]